jgi:long-subunit acyl-CoA synthetase (AMP-forming)
MMLVDRLKNLIKLKGGEYIALEAMEACYSTSPYCAALNGGVMVYGDGEMDRPVALFQADIIKIKAYAASQGITEEDPVALCKNETVYKVSFLTHTTCLPPDHARPSHAQMLSHRNRLRLESFSITASLNRPCLRK